MSVKARYFLIVPAVLIACWLAGRSLAAFPVHELEDPQPALAAAGEIPDPALTTLISRFAAEALGRN